MRQAIRTTTNSRNGQTRGGTALAWPTGFLLLALFIAPTVAVFLIALTNWQLGATSFVFTGLGNYRSLLSDPIFWRSLYNTIIYVGSVVPLSVFLGLAVALLIESGTTFRSVYRAAHFLPVMATIAAMSVVWELILHPMIGLVNYWVALIGLHSPNWFRDESTVLLAVVVIGVWQTFGLAMVLFLAGLKGIPKDLYEAASIDGAGAIDTLYAITLPSLRPISLLVSVYVAIRAFQIFDIVAVVTEGGPAHASEVLLYTIYNESFHFLRAGYGAAMSIVYLTILAGLTFVQVAMQYRNAVAHD